MSSGADRFVPAAFAAFASSAAAEVVTWPLTVVVCDCAGVCAPVVALAPAGCVFVAGAGADVGAGAAGVV